MFGFLKKKSLKRIRQLSTPDGHKAIITQEYTPHLLIPIRYHVSIYSKIDNCIIHGQVVYTSLEDAEVIINSWTLKL